MPPMILDQFENPFRSSSSNSFHDAANSFSPNHVATEPLFKDQDEISEEGESSSASSTQWAGFSSPAGSPVCESNQDPDKSESESELDENVFGSDSHDQPLVSESENLRGSFQQSHGQASLQPSQLTIPRSQYYGYKPPLDICEEKVAVKDLMDALKQQKLANQSSGPNNGEYDAYFEELELSNFAVYLPPSNTWHPCEMQGLQVLATKTGRGSFYFDGILSTGSTRRYVQGVPFEICSIGNYGKDSDEVGRDIWIQSVLNEKSKSNIFYSLATPSSEYERFHEGFLWLANLAKHFVDFCQSSEHPVSIHHFRLDFYAWLKQTHGASLAFNSWYQEYGNQDFRRAVARNIPFLFKESIGVDGGLRSQPIWRETMERDSVPNQQIQEKMTVVTPYVYECFKDISFGHHLLPIEPSSISKMQQTTQGKILDLTTSSLSASKPDKSPASRIPNRLTEVTVQVHTVQKKIKHIKIGDVLSVTKDGRGSVWKDEASQWKAASDCWYVCVQGIHEPNNGQKSYDAIWLYSPADTMCGLMKYPWPNELFLSDNCTCSHKRIEEDEILDVVSVLWHGYPSEAGRRLVVRQTYLENERFVTLQEAHKKCEHLKERDQTGTSINLSKYPIGQTVLIAPSQKSRHGLEPYEIVKYITEGSKHFAVLNRLRRRREIDGTGRPNELVYTTSHTEKVSVNKLERTCLVRLYRESDAEDRRIPAPYSRDGTGNAFYITSRLREENGISKLIPIEEDLPQTLIQGFDPTSILPESRKVLRGMDLYCGGGNFGRGIEEGGAVHNEWAVDLNKNAIHTYSANLKDPAGTKLFYGSVDDLLKQALQENPKKSDLIPFPGEVDCISAGSPCQGFSKLNVARNNDTGLKNQSLVASVASYVDFYRPKYGILENVMAMAQKSGNRDKDVLSQLICAIVGIGFQLQVFVLDAWSTGSPQSRTRLFVAFAAPGLEPLKHPELSHSHPPKVRDFGLGKLANGQSFGHRIRGLTPFEYVTAGDATKDLPRIGDGCTYQCTKEPDHVSGSGMSTDLRNQIRAIPTFPRGMNFSKAWNESNGVMTQEQRDLFPLYTREGKLRENTKHGSHAWGRVSPKGLFPTIVVALSAADSRVGCNLHWDDHRYLTTMEARRAQSFPDDEILLGSPAEGWKLMGNSVARSVALALGLSLREAWLKNDPDNEPLPTKDNISSPVLKERRSGIEIVIHTSARRSKPKTEQVKASAKQQTTPVVDAELASKSLGKANRRTVAPKKARGSRLVPDLESPMGEEGASSISSINRPVFTNTGRSRREIPDSMEASADEDSLPKETFHRFLGSLELRTPSSRDELALSESGENSKSRQAKLTSRKRPHGMIQKSEEMAHERSRKVPRVIIPSTTSSSGPASRPTNRQHPKAQSLNASTLVKKLDDVRRDQSRRRPEPLSNDDDDGDSNKEIAAAPSYSAQPSSLKSSVKSRANQTANSSSSKTPSKENAKDRVVISLVTEDEHEDEDEDLGTTAGLLGRAGVPSASKYVPVDNGNLLAYAQTNRFMNHGKNRKRVTVR